MKKKKVNLDDIEEGKTYQILTMPIVFSNTDISLSNKIIYQFGNKDEEIGLYDNEIETVWEVPEGE